MPKEYVVNLAWYGERYIFRVEACSKAYAKALAINKLAKNLDVQPGYCVPYFNDNHRDNWEVNHA